jgi:hypothetical protein
MMRLDDVPPAAGEWECMECGYIEEGLRGRRPKECPECGAPADAFDFFADEESDDDVWDSDELEDDEEEDQYDENLEDEDNT